MHLTNPPLSLNSVSLSMLRGKYSCSYITAAYGVISRRSLTEVFLAVRVSAEREPEDVDPLRQQSTE